MEKLPMCRICLVANVRILVVNKNLHEVYEKLTDIPFVTEDRRPMLACFVCCAKLKQCYRLMRQCVEAEKLFAQMMNEDYEPNTLINQDHFEFYSGFIKSPTENISIVHGYQTEDITIKEELPAVCEELDDIIEPKEEHQSDENISIVDGCQTASITIKEELPAVCERLDDIIEPKEEHQSGELEPENLDNSCLDVADIQPHHSEFLEVDVPFFEFEIEVEAEQEVSKKKRRASETTISTNIIMEPPSPSIEQSKKPLYRYCLVPTCRNTIRNAPDKVFFMVPRGEDIRRQWCKIMKRGMVSPSTCLHCCEDHFDIEEDTENYMMYKIMHLQEKQKTTLRLKKGILPHKF